MEKFRKIVGAVPGARQVWGLRKQLWRWTGGTDQHWTRQVMYRTTQQFIESLGPRHLKTLELSGSYWKTRFEFAEYRNVSYPDFDICKDQLDDQFDLIIVDQVFEHLLWPARAARHLHAMLKPGGYAVITTPFLMRVHNYPVDCSRWTELGLKHLLADNGFEIDKVQTGSWGNRACVRAVLKRWARYHPWFCSLKNEPDYPIVVWAFAQK